jgi:hypothetical protein
LIQKLTGRAEVLCADELVFFLGIDRPHPGLGHTDREKVISREWLRKFISRGTTNLHKTEFVNK